MLSTIYYAKLQFWMFWSVNFGSNKEVKSAHALKLIKLSKQNILYNKVVQIEYIFVFPLNAKSYAIAILVFFFRPTAKSFFSNVLSFDSKKLC